MSTRAVLAILVGLVVTLGAVIVVNENSQSASETVRRDALRSVKAAAYKQDVEAWRSRIAGCERGKLDRTAIAAALRAQSDYLNLVLEAKSVQEDVKRAARVNQAVQDDSAWDLESRTGDRLDCGELTPKPPAPDGVEPLP